jgi:hypothetical protein
VTRFFIPLIDVLLLLFCIFLLMPLVKGTGEGAEAESQAARDQRLRELEALLAKMKDPSDDLRQEMDRLRKENVQALQERLQVRVLEIDPTDGTLFHYDGGRVNIKNQAQALDLIRQDRRDLRDSRRELYYLILYPRGRSQYPLREQREQYERWFAEVAHGWDIPGAAPSRGDSP